MHDQRPQSTLDRSGRSARHAAPHEQHHHGTHEGSEEAARAHVETVAREQAREETAHERSGQAGDEALAVGLRSHAEGELGEPADEQTEHEQGEDEHGGHATAAIRARGLVRRFDDFTAVDGIDLEIQPGEIYGFLGPNGAGKSTTVRVLCTLIAPDGGSATVAGYDVATQPEQVRLRIGVALQDAALDPKQTGLELLRLQGRLYGLHRNEVATRLEQVRELVDIGDAIYRPIGTYSGGMKRRLDLAAALIHNPDILFLDEPTTGLDPVSRARVWEEVRRLNDELGTTIFLTTQYLEEADELADRVGILSEGKLVAEGRPDHLKRSVGEDMIIARVDGPGEAALTALRSLDGVSAAELHADELTIAASDGASVISPVAVTLSGSGVKVRDLTLRTTTLDDVFLELTGNRIEQSDDATDEEDHQ